MRVAVVGAGGFIGRHLLPALRGAGHVPLALRPDWLQADQAAHWAGLMRGFDAAVYLPGTVRDRAQGRSGWMNLLHHRAPAALGRCTKLVHLSALCAGESLYARTKQAGDAALVPLGATVLRPSLVVGAGGVTSGQLDLLSRLPLWPLPQEMQSCRLQPLRVEDLCELIARLLGEPAPEQPLTAAGPEVAPLLVWLQRRRAQTSCKPARVVTLPRLVARASARLGDHLPFTSWNRQTRELLRHDSVANGDIGWQAELLGRPLRGALEGPW